MQQSTSSSSCFWNTKPSSDSGFSLSIVHDLCSHTIKIGITIKPKSISLWIKGLVYYKKEEAPACQDKSICMRAMLLGNFRSQVELGDEQLCCFFWTTTSLIWRESNLNEWTKTWSRWKEEGNRNVNGSRKRSRKGERSLKILDISKIQRERDLPPETEQSIQAVTLSEACVVKVTQKRN